MALSDADLDRIQDKMELAINKHVPPIVTKVVDDHEVNCKYGRKLTRATWILIGAAAVIVLLNGGSLINLVKVIF